MTKPNRELWDHYAAKALTASIGTCRPGSPVDYAALAAELADAMLVGRAKRISVQPRATRPVRAEQR